MNYTDDAHIVELPVEFLPLWDAKDESERLMNVHNLSIRAAAKAAREKSAKGWVKLMCGGRHLATLSLAAYLAESPVSWCHPAGAVFGPILGGIGSSRGGVGNAVLDSTLGKNPRGGVENGRLT